MSSVAGSVEVEIRANLAPMQASLAKAQNEAKAFGNAAEKAFQNGFGGAASTAGRSLQAVNNDISNLRFQINDVATGLLSGGSPFIVLSQQAGQFSQILSGAGGVRGAIGLLGEAFSSMLNPVNLAIAGIGVAAYAASEFFGDTETDADAANEALKRHEAAIRNLKDAWGYAAEGLAEYLDMSPVVAEAGLARSTQATADAIRSEIGGALDQVNEALAYAGNNADAVIPDREAFDAVVQAATKLRDEYESGIVPNVIEFRETLDAARLNPNASQDVRDITDLLTAATDRAYELARALGAAQQANVPQMREPANPGAIGTPGNRPRVPNAPIPRESGNPRYDLTDPGETRRGRGGGGSKRDPFAEGMERAQERLRLLEQEKTAVGLSGEALARYRAEMQFLNSAHDEWNKLTESQRGALEAEADKIGDAAAEVERLKTAQTELKKAQQEAEDAFAAVGDAAENLFMGLMEGGDAAKQAIAQLVAELLRAALLGDGPLSFFFGGGLLSGGANVAGGSGPLDLGGFVGAGSVPSSSRGPSGRGVSGGRGGTVVGGTSIVINGNADQRTVEEIDARVKQAKRDIVKTLDEREKNRWRVN